VGTAGQGSKNERLWKQIFNMILVSEAKMPALLFRMVKEQTQIHAMKVQSHQKDCEVLHSFTLAFTAGAREPWRAVAAAA
jgi:hypothetical protein